jgi:hypothetical protein
MIVVHSTQGRPVYVAWLPESNFAL